MSEERRVQEQEEARRVLSPVRLAVLLLLGALFLVLGGSRADAAETGPVPAEGPSLLAGTLAAVDAGPTVATVGAAVDDVVDPVVTATEPVIQPVVEPVVTPVVTPLRPVVERVVPPLPALPVTGLVAPLGTGLDRRVTPAHRAAAEGRVEVAGPAAAAVAGSDTASETASVAVPRSGSATPPHGSPMSSSASTNTDGSTGTPVPYAVLLTAFVAVLLLAGGVAPRRIAPPLAPTFLPPVFPG